MTDQLMQELGELKGALKAHIEASKEFRYDLKKQLDDNRRLHDTAFKRIRGLERWGTVQKTLGGAAAALIGWIGWDKISGIFDQ